MTSNFASGTTQQAQCRYPPRVKLMKQDNMALCIVGVGYALYCTPLRVALIEMNCMEDKIVGG